MDKSDSLDEVFEYAIDREIDANQFYLALAERVDNVEMRKGKIFTDDPNEIYVGCCHWWLLHFEILQ